MAAQTREEFRAVDQQGLRPQPGSNPTPIDAFPSGARSSEHLPFFHIIPYQFFETRLANRYAEGMLKYGYGNWEKGLQDPQFLADRLNHAIKHLHKAAARFAREIHLAEGAGTTFLGSEPSDDDEAAVMWGMICIMAAQALARSQRKETGGGVQRGATIR